MKMVDKIKFIFVMSLTLGRIPLILGFLAMNLINSDARDNPIWFSTAFAIMILSALTDLFDGYFARKFNMTSRFGAYADPLADKVFYLTALPTLIYLAGLRGPDQFIHVRLLLGLAVIFLLRDQWVSFLRSIGAHYNVDAKANWSGKARTVISFPSICCIYYYLQAPSDWALQLPRLFIYSVEGASVVINLISIWVYSAYYWEWLKKDIRTP
ncbi:CDP-alcohol phosphatidyltransferase family protein [Candidatus Hydrogenedentota bacterium]